MMDNKTRKELPDVFRTAMFSELGMTGRTVLLAVLAGLYVAVAASLKYQAGGAMVCALVSGACVLLLCVTAWRVMPCKKTVLLLMLALACGAAGLAHVGMMDVAPGRMSKVITPMLEGMWPYDLLTAMAWQEGNWSGGYLLVMALVSRIENFSQMYALKLIDFACQCAVAMAVLRLALRGGAGKVASICGMLLCTLMPTALLNGGCWMEFDALFCALALWGLVGMLEGKFWGCLLVGMAGAFRLQALMLAPLMIPLYMKKRIALWHPLCGLAGYVIPQIPFLLDGQGWEAVFGRYAVQIQDFTYEGAGLTDHAAGVFGLMNIASYREFSGMGMYFAFACALIVAALLITSRVEGERVWLLSALLLCCGLPLVLPQQTARSLFMAGMLSLTLVDTREGVLTALALEVVSLCCYLAAIFNLEVLPLSVLSLLAIGAATFTAVRLVDALKEGARHEISG